MDLDRVLHYKSCACTLGTFIMVEQKADTVSAFSMLTTGLFSVSACTHVFLIRKNRIMESSVAGIDALRLCCYLQGGKKKKLMGIAWNPCCYTFSPVLHQWTRKVIWRCPRGWAPAPTWEAQMKPLAHSFTLAQWWQVWLFWRSEQQIDYSLSPSFPFFLLLLATMLKTKKQTL